MSYAKVNHKDELVKDDDNKRDGNDEDATLLFGDDEKQSFNGERKEGLSIKKPLLAMLLLFIVGVSWQTFGGNPPLGRERNPAGKINGKDTFLKKTVHWKNSRVLFFAGVKETGHDIVESAVNEVCETGQIKCVRLCEISTIDWLRFVPKKFNELLERMSEEYGKIRQEAAGEEETVFMVNNWGHCPKATTSFTFPATEFGQDPLRSVDLMQHARLAEAEGVDIRFVLLVDRNATATVEGFMRDFVPLDTSATDSHALRAVQMSYERLWLQLHLMDRRFFRAIDTTNVGYGDYSTEFPLYGQDDDQTLDSWTGLQGLQVALETHRYDARKRFVTRLIPDGSFSKGKWKNATNMHLPFTNFSQLSMPRVKQAQDGLIEFLETGKTFPLVEKEVFHNEESPRPRAIFIAGLEGTGHHLFRAIYGKLAKQGLVDHFCPATKALRDICFCQRSKGCVAARNSLDKAFVKLAKTNQRSPGKIHFLNANGCNNGAGMLSYPDMGGPFKGFKYLDLVTMAESAERAGVDFRVIVLSRDAREVLISTIVHRSFGPTRELRILENTANALIQQVELIDPKFILTCANMNSLDFVPHMEKGLGIRVRELVEQVWHKPHKKNLTGGVGRHSAESLTSFVEITKYLEQETCSDYFSK